MTQLIRFLNELLKEEGVDYNLVYPKLIQTSPEMYVTELDTNSQNISKLTESRKELTYYLVDEKFQIEEKMLIFDNSCAAFTLFSYIFGGFYHDSGTFY